MNYCKVLWLHWYFFNSIIIYCVCIVLICLADFHVDAGYWVNSSKLYLLVIVRISILLWIVVIFTFFYYSYCYWRPDWRPGMSCWHFFMNCTCFCFHVLRFHILHFHVRQFGPSFSHPAFSCLSICSFIFMSCIFNPRDFDCPSFWRPVFSVNLLPARQLVQFYLSVVVFVNDCNKARYYNIITL